MEEENTTGVGLSMRDLVLEIRQDVKHLELKLELIDRQGSIGTRDELRDHETRIRSVERWKYGIPVSMLIAVVTALGYLAHQLGI